MAALLEWGMGNALLATGLAILVAVLARLRSRTSPVLLHALWVLVLVRLLLPPLPGWRFAVPLPSLEDSRSSASVRSEGVGPVDPVALASPEASGAVEPDPLFHPESAKARSESVVPLLRSGSVEAVPAMRPAEERVPVGTHPATSAVAASAPRDQSPLVTQEVPAAGRPRVGVVSIPTLLGGVWLGGSLLGMLIVLYHTLRFRSWLRNAEPAGPDLIEVGRQVGRDLGLKSLPRIVVTSGNVIPALWPVGRLTVLLPRSLVEELPREVLATLLSHELIHVRRRDHWIRFLELLATVGFWWLPTVYGVRRRLHEAEEEACDACLVGTWPERAADYAHGLVAAVELLSRRNVGLPATGLTGLEQLQQRITRLFEGGTSPRLSRSAIVMLAIAGVMACSAGLKRAVVAQKPPPRNTAAPVPAAKPDAPAGPKADDLYRARLTVSAARPLGIDSLPVAWEISEKRLSPDGKRLAFVGSVPSSGKTEHGLFVVDLESGELRQLSRKMIRMGFCWSPDSRKIATGHAAGYVVDYPLVMIDVVTGDVEGTGVLGHAPAWSPDGTEIACVTDRHRADGQPDGRVGIWNIARREFRQVTPPGQTVSIEETGESFTVGAVRPTWSPDSRRIAFEVLARHRKGETRLSDWQLWVVDRDGTGLRQLAHDRPEVDHAFEWAEDGSHLKVGQERKTLDATGGRPLAEAGWPGPPAAMAAVLEREKAAVERGAKYDTARVLERNRAWQRPDMSRLANLQFTHRMAPARLDERFSWRRDGSCSVEVLLREDKQGPEEVGRLWALTSGGDVLTRRPDSPYPRRTPTALEKGDDERWGHLMGTRTCFVALDWGRHPDRYVVVDARPGEPGQTVLTLKTNFMHPTFRDNRRRINAGAMFHTTSWSYVHDLFAGRTDLLIDDAMGRILRESADLGDDSRSIEFDRWIDLPNGDAVPGRIRIAMPGHQFHVEYEFHVPVEPLWILKAGRSWFDGKEPQTEELVDLKWDVAAPDVDRHLASLQTAIDELAQPAVEPQPVSNTVLPLNLGDTVPLRWTGVDDPVCRSIESLRFTIDRFGWEPGGLPLLQPLCLELVVPQLPARIASPEPLTVTLYDKQGAPVDTFAIPIAGFESLGRPAEPFLSRIRKSSRLWIDPDRSALPEVSYRFHLDSKATEHSTRDPDNANALRGITYRSALDTMVASPKEFRAPIQFEASLDGRRVDVAVIVGPPVNRQTGIGIQGTYVGGYVSSQSEQTLLVIDHETGRPLLERFSDDEIRYLDYREPEAGQFVPMRITHTGLDLEAMFRDAKYGSTGVGRPSRRQMDFRFQLVEDRSWLFAQAIEPGGRNGAYVDSIRVGGQPPKRVDVLEDAAPEVLPLDVKALTDRTLPPEATAFERSLVSYGDFTTRPEFEGLKRTVWDGQRRVWVKLNYPRFGEHLLGWSLHRTTAGGVTSATTLANEVTFARTAAAAAVLDRAVRVDVAADEGRKTRLRSVQLHRNDAREWSATLKVVSEAYLTEQSSVAAMVLLDQEGRPLASGQASLTCRVIDSPYVQDVVVDLGALPEAVRPSHVLLGLKSEVIGGPVGSMWGRFMDDGPVFLIDRLLASPHVEIWRAGLYALYRDGRTGYLRVNEQHPERQRSEAAQVLGRYRSHFERLLVEGQDVEGLGLLCRLAGHSGDAAYESRLVELLDHPELSVREGAAVGLGLLGNPRGRGLIRTLLDRQPKGVLAGDAGMALDRLGEGATSGR